MNYYNENDRTAAQWLRNLVSSGLIPPGRVDDRDIRTVDPDELAEYSQCHFFAGIAGWSRALELAGIPPDVHVWTGSCPCQPFSVAGKRKGNADERHLWPAFLRLIEKRRPPVIFGEQVASADGRKWLAGVRADLETLGYRVGSADLCAASVGAPHIRQRLYWVADADGGEPWNGDLQRGRLDGLKSEDGGTGARSPRLADPSRGGLGVDRRASGEPGHVDERRAPHGLADSEDSDRRSRIGEAEEGTRPEEVGGRRLGERGADALPAGGMVDPVVEGLEGHAGHGGEGDEPGRDRAVEDGSTRPTGPARRMDNAPIVGRSRGSEGDSSEDRGGPRRSIQAAGPGRGGPWSGSYVVRCSDSKYRRVPLEPAFFPLAARLPGRVGRLRAYGNAIVPPLAAEFVKAYLEARALKP